MALGVPTREIKIRLGLTQEPKLGWALMSKMLSDEIHLVNATITHPPSNSSKRYDRPANIRMASWKKQFYMQQLFNNCNKRWKDMHLELTHVKNVLFSSGAKDIQLCPSSPANIPRRCLEQGPQKQTFPFVNPSIVSIEQDRESHTMFPFLHNLQLTSFMDIV